MTCISPLTGYRTSGGKFTTRRRDGFVDLPTTVPCGQCIGCRVDRCEMWTARIMHESQMHKTNCFLTLTYDQRNLPEDYGLHVEHWQKFVRDLRYRVGKIRYYHCGEYGEKTGRPHYHAAIFGEDFSFDRVTVKSNTPYPYWNSPTVLEAWGRGHTTIGNLTPQTARYIAKYITKKKTGQQGKELYGDRKPPYTTSSKKPGIGATWYEKYGKEVHPDDFIVDEKGRKRRVPKYYDRLLEKEDPEAYQEIKALRHRKGLEADFDHDRRYAREKILEQKANRKEGTI